jgi:lipopolysaccharide/colanic/teichoic acid biosynthesis glycosyltransferase
MTYSVTAPAARARVGDLGNVLLGQVHCRIRPMPGKRAFDVIVSVIALAALLAFFPAVALAIKLWDRGPVFYSQLRVGKDGLLFRIWKFRSMIVGAEAFLDEHRHANVTDGLLFRMEKDPRVTRVGALLRRCSIDELPQLFNVLRGEMSFVGPRPLAVDPEDFDEVATRRHAIRPGITGPWQVGGGNALSYDEMVSMDLGYIAGWSFRTDLWLLVRTVPVLLNSRVVV